MTNLQKETKRTYEKLVNFPSKNNAQTKNTQYRRRFLLLKIIVYHFREKWSVGVADVDKLARCNNGEKYLLVAVDGSSQTLRCLRMRTNTSQEETAKKVVLAIELQKVWSDKGTEFKSVFLRFCWNTHIDTYTLHSENKSAFRERIIRPLENILQKQLRNMCSYYYFNELQSFVQTMNSGVNRMTVLTPKKSLKKHLPKSASSTAERQLFRQPK